MTASKGYAALFTGAVSPFIRLSPTSCLSFSAPSLATRKIIVRRAFFFHFSESRRLRHPSKSSLDEDIRSGSIFAHSRNDNTDGFESNYDEIADLAIGVRRRKRSEEGAQVSGGKLLDMAVGRAIRTLSSKAGAQNSFEASVDDLLSVASDRVSMTMESYQDDIVGMDVKVERAREGSSSQGHEDKRRYLGNPCVTGTALAQSLWSSVIIPNVDTVIDATCGNGKDSLAMADLLFARDGTASMSANEKTDVDEMVPSPELLCIDIQQRACENTQRSLLHAVDQETFSKCVRVLVTSHAPLPKPRDGRSVGLVAYNLGYLPGTDDKQAFTTKFVTTLFSLADAALLLRVGGMLSVMTYPGTCLDEANAVKFFCEGLAMLTSRDPGGWRGYVDKIPNDTSGGYSVRDLVQSSLERVARDGDVSQTWRVFEHKPLGRPLSPILLAAMRIK